MINALTKLDNNRTNLPWWLDEFFSGFEPYGFSLAGASRMTSRWTDDGIIYEINLAGFKKEQIKIKIEADYINIFAENKNRRVQEGFNLPVYVDAAQLSAKLEDGVLRLIAPFTAAAKGREIKIE